MGRKLQMTIRFDDAVYDELKERARQNYRTVNQEILYLINKGKSQEERERGDSQ